MPEGDTVFVHAQLLSPRLVGRTVTHAFSRWPAVVQGVVGRTVTTLEPIGKHLLIGLDDRTTLRVHLGMKGKWSRLPPGERARVMPGNVSLRLDTKEDGLLCTKAPTVERFRTRERRIHPVLSRLGPDVLDPDFEPDSVLPRLGRATEAVTVSEVLLDQRVACGIGNVYKSEVCFALRLDPFTPPAAVEAEQWVGLYLKSQTWMRANCRSAPRNTTGFGRGQPRLWVYGRRGRPCLVCRTRVQAKVHGRDLPRVTYWCSTCQPRYGSALEAP
ncbi:MAG: DNA-formamidopyrimidine glycosylase family protein [Myxococcota bacterium]